MRLGPPCLLGLSLIALRASDVPVASDAVQQGDFIKTLVFSGELQAVEETLINTPNIARLWIYPISYLAPEGKMVQAGEVLVQFDRTAMEYRKLETEKAREEARLAVARKQTELEIRRQDALSKVASAEKTLRIAELHAEIAPELLPAADAEKYQHELAQAKVDLENALGQLQNQAEAGQAELEVERLKLGKAELDLTQMVGDLEKMTIYARAPGVPLYAYGYNDRKVQVGDNVYKGSPVLRIPDMDRVKVVVSVFDSEFPALREGQPATAVLDAAPERSFPAQVIRIPEAATPPRVRFTRSPSRMFQVEVLLLETDPDLMKPGMSARVEIQVHAGSGLIVPRCKIFQGPDGATQVQPRGSPPVAVSILDSNQGQALIEGSLSAGVLLEDPPAGSLPRGRGHEWHTLERDDFRFTVAGSGTLEAARSTDITPPVVPNVWNFKIKRMVPEGKAVVTGEVVAELDAPEVHTTLLAELASLDKVRQELEKTNASLELKLDGLELELEEAQAAAEKASGKLQQARQFESSLKIREAEFEAEFAQQKVAILEEKLKLTRKGVQLELDLLRDRERLHQQLAASAQDVLSKLQRRAPRDGIAIYSKNWNNEKKQVGGDVNVHETVLYLPDLNSLRVAGQISELDAGKIQLDQEVEVTIDALPDRSFVGRITEISQIFTLASFDRPVKVVEVKVELDKVDPNTMRPGMVARLRVAIDRFERVLAVPLQMVQIQDGKPYVWVNRSGQPVKTPIEIGRNNGVVGIVEKGLQEGDQILTHPPRPSRNFFTQP